MLNDPNRCRSASRARRGFTLVELLVVIGIIALLISILLPALSKAREQGKKTVCLTGLRSFGQVLQLYANSYKGRVPIGYASTKHGGYMIYQNDKWAPMGYLYEAGLLKDGASAYFCPSSSDLRWMYATEANRWPPPVTGQLCRLGMTLRPAVQFITPASGQYWVPASSTWDAVNLRGKIPQISQFKSKAIACEMMGEPMNDPNYNVDPSLLRHKNVMNVLYSDYSAIGVDTTGVDSVDGQSINSLLVQLAALKAVPTGQQMNDIYLDELGTRPKGIWAKFDKEKQ